MFQICGDVEAVGFPVQNVYKMTYGDENTTFEPMNGYEKGNPGNIPYWAPMQIWFDFTDQTSYFR